MFFNRQRISGFINATLFERGDSVMFIPFWVITKNTYKNENE